MMGSPICTECGEHCKPEEEEFDFPASHQGSSGTHKTGNYVSNCCGATIGDYNEH